MPCNLQSGLKNLQPFNIYKPFWLLQVAIASGEGRFVDSVRKAQLGINLPFVKCVDAKGLRLKDDHLHLTTMSEVHLGIKLAHAFLSTLK